MRKSDLKVVIKLSKEGELLILDAIITGAPNRLGLTRTRPYDKKTLEILTTDFQINDLMEFVDTLKPYFSIESVEIEQ
ncbi:MAG: hypothetical protein ACP5S8_06820 [Hydrogenobaculum sp.]